MPSGVYIRNKEYCEKISKERKGICFNTGRTHFRKGNHPKTEFKKGQISYWKGKKRPDITGVNHWAYGKKFSEEIRRKISLGHKGINAGEKSYQWKGGVSKDKKYIALRIKKWRSENPLYVKWQNLQRRILTNDLSIKTIQQIYEYNIKQYGTLTCYLCLKPIEFGKDHLEHKTPLCRGGNNLYENLAVACNDCNCKKGKKTVKEFKNGGCRVPSGNYR